MRRALLAVVLAAAPALSAAQSIECDLGDREVMHVQFVGNRKFSSSELEDAIVTAPDSWMRRSIGIPLGAKHCLDTLEVQRDVLRLQIYYRLRGYYNATVIQSVIALSTKAVNVRFTIAEGPATLVDSITVLGIDSVPGKAQLLKPFTKFKGRPFSRVLLQSLIDTAMVRLWDHGYPYAERPLTSFSVDSTTHRASVELTFFQRFLGQSVPLPPTRARITTIAISSTPGPDSGKVSPQTVRKLLFIKSGKVYSQEDVASSQRELYSLELVRHVDVDLLPDSEQASDTALKMRVLYTEADQHSLRLGGGWATFDCLRAQMRYSDRDLFEGAERFDFNARLSHIALCTAKVKEDPSSQGINYYVSGTLRLPTLFGPRNQPSITLFSERSSEYKAYLRITPIGGVLAFNRDLDPRGIRPGLPLSLTARVEYGQTRAQPAVFCQLFNVCSGADIARLQQNSLLLVLGAGLTHDQTNSLLNATTGSLQRIELRWGESAQDTGAASRWTRLLGEAAYYHTFGSSVLATRIQIAGLFVPWTLFDPATEFVPPEERLYAGGPNSVRGYGQNLLGPIVYTVNGIDSSQMSGSNKIYQVTPATTVTQYSAAGGNTSVVATVEWRVTMPKPWNVIELAAFVDAGFVWNRGATDSPGHTIGVGLGDIKVTPGMGVRYLSPVGPIRVDFAYNKYGTGFGAAYYETPVTNDLLCVSPGNSFDRGVVPAGEVCPLTYQPKASPGFFQHLTFNFSIGQAF
jgi:outer membrane protein insertion porin family/translocation and assembly module TamA